jgi:hypothetical protein
MFKTATKLFSNKSKDKQTYENLLILSSLDIAVVEYDRLVGQIIRGSAVGEGPQAPYRCNVSNLIICLFSFFKAMVAKNFYFYRALPKHD